MTLALLGLGGAASGWAPASVHVYTETTTVDTYVVMGTVQVNAMPAIQNYITAATNNLLLKFEYTIDGVNWITEITDFPVTAGTTGVVTAIRNASQYRVSVKPAVAGNHGTATWKLYLSRIILPPEYRAGMAYESKTVTNAAVVSLTLATYGASTAANVTVEDNPIRVRWDGGAPTISEGHLLQSGDTLRLDYTSDITDFKAIATGADAKIRVTYSR